MKKVIGYICVFLFILMFISACGCDNEDSDAKASLGIGDMNATTYQSISMEEVDVKIEEKDSFILYIYEPDCGGCIAFKPIIDSVINSENLIIYALRSSNISSGHELNSAKGTPSLVVYNKGKILKKVTDSGSDKKYFKNDEGFVSFLNRYTYMPTMYYINKDQLIDKVNNDESFIIYYSRNDCGDCKYMYKNYLKEFLYNNPTTKRIYVIETNVEGIRYLNGESPSDSAEAAAQWQAFKDQFGLSETGNPTFGHGVGYVPTIQYYNNGELSDMVVYFNDFDDSGYVRNPDNSISVIINNSYYSDNPYIDEIIPYSEYQATLAPFYNSKLTAFINDYLGLVD